MVPGGGGGGGILCVSVIEAKNVLAADTASDLSFYVKLRLGHSEVKTDTCANNIAPKFLKDVRLPVATPASDILRMDMLQLGPRGDLVVGSAELLVASLVNKGTIVHWFDLKAFNQSAGAQLCCVLRYLTANASRPLTPSYAITTREARERAVTGQPLGTLQAPGPTATRALFSDTNTVPAAAAAKQPPPAAVAAAAPWAPTTPAMSAAASRIPRATEAHDSPTQSAAAAAAHPPSNSPLPSPLLTRQSSAAALTIERQASTPAAAAAAAAFQASGRAAPASAPEAQQRWLPAPVSIALGLVLGAALYILRRRPPASEVCSHDEVSLVSSCFNKSSYEKYRQRRWRE